MISEKKKILIIGAGPAGLAAAHTLANNGGFDITIWEKELVVGGLSRTLEYKGNLFDLGPHRFFSKSKEVNDFWQEVMPLQSNTSIKLSDNTENTERVMTLKHRFTRMYYDRHFFDYPLKINLNNIFALGLNKGFLIIVSFIKSKLKPISPENNLEDFYINRFGTQLYNLFFKDYTKKVWGLECNQIPKEWGKQRIKDLSLIKMIFNFVLKSCGLRTKQRASLVDKFIYPKYGAGFFYKILSDILINKGVKIEFGVNVDNLYHDGNRILSVSGKKINGEKLQENFSEIITTMPIDELISSLKPEPTDEIKSISKLSYRNSIIVAALYKELTLKNDTKHPTKNRIIPDNWIYIQDPSVKLGRVSIFNNFSESMLKDVNLPWMSLEYFCNSSDELWKMSDEEIILLARQELQKINLAESTLFIDGKVERVEKSYPAYFGTYEKFSHIQNYLDTFSNLFPAGRNGQHKYNNMDHSITSGFSAANLIINNQINKNILWSINTDQTYHESK